MDKPHIFRYVEGSPIPLNQKETAARFTVVNDQGEFRQVWVDDIQTRRPAIMARLEGKTRYVGEPCADCGHTEYFAYPLTMYTGRNYLFPLSTFGKPECLHCKAHPECRSEERKELAELVRRVAESSPEGNPVLGAVRVMIDDIVAPLRNMLFIVAMSYGRHRDGSNPIPRRVTPMERVEAIDGFITACEITQ